MLHSNAPRTVFVTILLATLLPTSVALAGDIPPRPEKIDFPPRTFEVPDASSFRFELSNGIPVYAVPDREFPLVTIAALFRGGGYLEPTDTAGLASIASEVWRTGGAGERSARELDEAVDFLAANLSTRIGSTTGSVTLNVLSSKLDEAMPLLMDLLLRPRFDEARFAKATDDLIQRMRERNDDTSQIEARAWQRLIYGDDYWLNNLPTKASVEALTPEACRRFVSRLVRADNLVLAVAGDFSDDTMRDRLERTFGRLEPAETPLPDVPQPTHVPAPGVYLIHKEDVNQGRVSIGQIGLREGHPDELALLVMNDILGGGGFTSRITKQVRANEGLAYTASSRFGFPHSYPGAFRAFFQSKGPTCAAGGSMVLDEIKRIRTEPVAAEELETAKTSFIEPFPNRFERAIQTAMLFARDELIGRSHSYWATYRDRVAAITAEDVLEAARTHLHADRLVVLMVGNVAEIQQGHPDYEAQLTDLGQVTVLPLRDPMTLEPLVETAE